jgi:hypothetical protein
MAKRKKATRKTTAKKQKKFQSSAQRVKPAFLANELNEAAHRKKRR